MTSHLSKEKIQLVGCTLSNNISQQRYKSTVSDSPYNETYEKAFSNARSFDRHYNYDHQPYTVPSAVREFLEPIRHIPPTDNQKDGRYYYSLTQSHCQAQKQNVPLTSYAKSGMIPLAPNHIILQDEDGIQCLRDSGRLARHFLDLTCQLAHKKVTNSSGQMSYLGTTEIDSILHQSILEAGAYPSPLNYHGFPRTICSSVNEVICHGIPDGRVLREGDLASFDVSCFYQGYHGDNCGTVLVGDNCEDNLNDGEEGEEKKPKIFFNSMQKEELFVSGRRLIRATQEALEAGISTVRPGSCLTEIGEAISSVSDAYGYSSVEKYRGHGIGRTFHCPPFVKHFRNTDVLELYPGMVFTIEPMLTEGSALCKEWDSDGWTVVTKDGGRAAQFEHMVAITEEGAEILTLPS